LLLAINEQRINGIRWGKAWQGLHGLTCCKPSQSQFGYTQVRYKQGALKRLSQECGAANDSVYLI
jgi:hypothetical protein